MPARSRRCWRPTSAGTRKNSDAPMSRTGHQASTSSSIPRPRTKSASGSAASTITPTSSRTRPAISSMVRLTGRVYGGIMPRMPGPPGARWLLLALGRRLPRTRGEQRVEGLRAEITIRRDRWGVPHVDASSDADAWFGLGFCHGQDRGFQLELLARAGRGTLSALLGEATLPLDRLSRTLGFHRVARAQLPRLDPDMREGLEAYVAGVNAAVTSGPRPHELALLRATATAWAAEDVLAFLGLQSLALSGNWDTELGRLHVLLADGPDALAAVAPAYPEALPAHVPVGDI